MLSRLYSLILLLCLAKEAAAQQNYPGASIQINYDGTLGNEKICLSNDNPTAGGVWNMQTGQTATITFNQRLDPLPYWCQASGYGGKNVVCTLPGLYSLQLPGKPNTDYPMTIVTRPGNPPVNAMISVNSYTPITMPGNCLY